MRLNGKNCYKVILNVKLAANDQINRIFVFLKRDLPQEIVCPCPWAIYMYMTIIFKHLLWSIKDKFHVEPPWEGEEKVDINEPGHMTKMAAVSIYIKHL